MGNGCGFCGKTTGPFTRVEGLFDVLMCPSCRHQRGHPPGPYPAMTPEQMRASLELLPTWVLAQKVVANRAVRALQLAQARADAAAPPPLPHRPAHRPGPLPPGPLREAHLDAARRGYWPVDRDWLDGAGVSPWDRPPNPIGR
jgi:hypothetical protein